MTYGESIDFCEKHGAVFRFVKRRERGEFLAANMEIPGAYALEMAVDILGKTVVGHMPLDSSKAPSDAVAVALIGCVEWFQKNQGRAIGAGGN
jgi:hypothetical protein